VLNGGTNHEWTKHLAYFFLGGVMLAVAIPQRAQSPAAPSSPDEQARRSVAVNTLRAINTAEYAYKFRHGTFASWNVLLAAENLLGEACILPFRMNRNCE